LAFCIVSTLFASVVLSVCSHWNDRGLGRPAQDQGLFISRVGLDVSAITLNRIRLQAKITLDDSSSRATCREYCCTASADSISLEITGVITH
jgi:hypothetical protein